jgi:Rieske Fe-S protein
MNRRSFLSVAAATISLPVLGGCGRRGNSTQTRAGAADTQRLVWKLGPRSSVADGVTGRWSAKTNGAVFVVRSGKRIYALSSLCTHMGCVLDVDGVGAVAFACGCHGSQFGLDGARLAGPARRPLLRYGIAVDDSDQIVIDKSVTFQPDQADALGSYIFIY